MEFRLVLENFEQDSSKDSNVQTEISNLWKAAVPSLESF